MTNTNYSDKFLQQVRNVYEKNAHEKIFDDYRINIYFTENLKDNNNIKIQFMIFKDSDIYRENQEYSTQTFMSIVLRMDENAADNFSIFREIVFDAENHLIDKQKFCPEFFDFEPEVPVIKPELINLLIEKHGITVENMSTNVMSKIAPAVNLEINNEDNEKGNLKFSKHFDYKNLDKNQEPITEISLRYEYKGLRVPSEDCLVDVLNKFKEKKEEFEEYFNSNTI